MTTTFIFPPPPIASLAVVGRPERFAVRRIFCVGRNYAAHASEMGHAVDKTAMQPFYFMKDSSALVESGATIPYPSGTKNFHHEVELVVAIGVDGFGVSEKEAERLIFGYAVGLDMTRRDLQAAAKEKGLPWDVAKNFEHAAVCAPIVPMARVIESGAIGLKVNGQTRQSSDIVHLIWDIRELLADLSRFYHLQAGDLLYTGTPEGVGAVLPGDVLHGTIANVGEVSLTIGERE